MVQTDSSRELLKCHQTMIISQRLKVLGLLNPYSNRRKQPYITNPTSDSRRVTCSISPVPVTITGASLAAFPPFLSHHPTGARVPGTPPPPGCTKKLTFTNAGSPDRQLYEHHNVRSGICFLTSISTLHPAP